MAKCSRCGADLTEGKSFCTFCGARVDESEQNKGKNYDFSNVMYGGKDFADEFDPRDIVENKLLCILSYMGILFIIGLIAQPNSKVVKFHANQGFVLFLAEMVLGVSAGVIGIFPIIGWIIAGLIGTASGVMVLAAFLYELVNIIDGKVKRLPIIGNITIIK